MTARGVNELDNSFVDIAVLQVSFNSIGRRRHCIRSFEICLYT